MLFVVNSAILLLGFGLNIPTAVFMGSRPARGVWAYRAGVGLLLVYSLLAIPAALLVPRFERLEKWAAEKGLAFGSREELVARPEVLAHYQALVDQLSEDLAKFERIKRIKLLATEFSIEAGELTPTMKVKRRVIEQKYKTLIDEIYTEAATPEKVSEPARLMRDA